MNNNITSPLEPHRRFRRVLLAPGKFPWRDGKGGVSLLVGVLLSLCFPNRALALPIKIMPLGDSITEGSGSGPDNAGYRIGLWNRLQGGPMSNVEFVGSQVSPNLGGGFDNDHEGHPGWTVGQISNDVESWLQTYTPDIILLHIGTNNYQGSPSDAADELDALVDKIFAASPGTQLCLASIVGVRGTTPTFFTDYNARIPGIVSDKAALGKNIIFVDMYNLSGLVYSATSPDFTDYLHPSVIGYDKMGVVWYNVIVPEPTTLSLLIPGGLVLLWRRRK